MSFSTVSLSVALLGSLKMWLYVQKVALEGPFADSFVIITILAWSRKGNSWKLWSGVSNSFCKVHKSSNLIIQTGSQFLIAPIPCFTQVIFSVFHQDVRTYLAEWERLWQEQVMKCIHYKGSTEICLIISLHWCRNNQSDIHCVVQNNLHMHHSCDLYQIQTQAVKWPSVKTLDTFIICSAVSEQDLFLKQFWKPLEQLLKPVSN